MGLFKLNVGQRRVIELIKSAAKEILIASGSRSGKTFILIWAIITIALRFPGSRHLVARKHFNHVKGSIWMDTLPKVLSICFPELKGLVKFNNVDFFLILPNGSEIWCAGLDDKDRVDKILGREYMTIFFNECSEISYDSYTTVKSRLAQSCSYLNDQGQIVWGKNMCFLDENPTSSKHWSKVLFIDKIDPESRAKVKDPTRYAFTYIHPSENTENINKDYIEMLENLPPAKRKRFLDGQFSDGSQNALWDYNCINLARVTNRPHLIRIVVSIDPAVTATDKSDETGIVVRGLGVDRHLYILDDRTGTYKPEEWAARAIEVYDHWNADLIVGEVNNGGDLVEAVIRQVRANVSYKKVHATKNKYTRAEPVASLMNMTPPKDHIVGELPDLEEEMCNWEGKTGEASPNRIDASVWGAFELMPDLNPQKQAVSGSFGAAMRGRV